MQIDKTSSLLISYAGYPYSPSSFMPDNGLANLAAILTENGHKTKILDYGTVEIVKRFMPDYIRKGQERLWERLNRKAGSKQSITLYEKLLLYILDKLLEIRQKSETKK